MAEQPNPPPRPQSRTTPLGIYDKPRHDRVSGIEIVAMILSGLWLVGALAFFLTGSDRSTDTDGMRFLVTMLAVFMPVAMIWVAATAAKSSRVMREESQRLQTAIDAIRQAYIAQQQGRDISSEPSVSRKLDEIAAAARKTETALATFQTRRDAEPLRPAAAPAASEPAADDQPALALGTSAEEIAPPIGAEDFIRALNFPETAEDEEGFAARRQAMLDREPAQLIQARQDILTLLSQDGI
ncbi:MAG: hypothetical protein AAFU86_10820, partial [Pseudomonadota bacterium]